MINLVLIGPPGAGKGTQAARLVRDYGLVHLSTGDLLRDAIKAETSLGRKAKAAVDIGALVPNEFVIDLVQERLSDKNPQQGFILDGFPRTVRQAEALEGVLQNLNTALNHVILFDIPLGLLEDRIVKRAEQSKAVGTPTRSDDNVAVLKRRVDEFALATAALSPFYEHRQLLRRVDAAASIDDVTAQIGSLLRR